MVKPYPSVALLFEKFGPYHVARLKAARQILPVTGVEWRPVSPDYPWFSTDVPEDVVRCDLDERDGAIGAKELRSSLYQRLDEIAPDVVAVPGWSEVGSLLALQWSRSRARAAIMMCDSTYIDAPRFWTGESIKRHILASTAASFVSGTRSKQYLEMLGVPSERIATGYDVIDNERFRRGAEYARANAQKERKRLGLPEHYAIFVGRLIEKKNTSGLLKAFSAYHRLSTPRRNLSLVIVGDGALAADLRCEAKLLEILPFVHFHGHANEADLPSLYGLSQFFVLPSLVEQWGLVVNEAIACGLPILISDRSGASADLLDAGKNGFGFDPHNFRELTRKIDTLANQVNLKSFGRRSEEISRTWGLDRFAEGLQKSALIACAARKQSRFLSDVVVNGILMKQSIQEQVRHGTGRRLWTNPQPEF